MTFIVLSGGRLPEYGDEFAAGFDIYSAENVTIPSGDRVAVGTGLILDVEPKANWYIRIAPRSGLALMHGIDVLAGVVDSSYKKEIKVVLVNLGHEEVTLPQGTRIAQGIATPVIRLFLPVKDAPRIGGFGSTGLK